MWRVIERTALEHKTALIIEDDARSLLALGSLLDSFGIQYKRNTTGASVLDQARRLRPDVILLDLSLPDGDPFAICATLAQDPALGRVPVIAMVDDDVFEDMLPTIRQADFADVITKPVGQRELADLLSQIVGSD